MKPQISLRFCTRRVLLMSTAIVMVPFAQAHAVDALTTPTGESVVAGAASFDRPVEGLLNVNQATHRAVINWDNFDIGTDATTEFFQPNANSLAVNRVVGGGDPTQILGTLRANGQLMVLDRNGVLFGPDSNVDASGIIASTGDVANADVINGGDLEITGATEGTIENQGSISVADAGLAALVGPTVRNSGIINAKFGRVELASGSQATVDFFGDNLVELAVDSELEHALIENSGDILAEGGRVHITTAVAKDIVDNSINLSGLVDVSSITNEAGRIVLAGAEDTTISGDLLANSEVAGGRVSVDSGDIGITSTAEIAANSSFDGPAGKVNLNAENSIDTQGKVTANGEEDGGRVTIAAGDNAAIGGNVEARATGIGTGGRISIDSGGDETLISGKLRADGIDDGGFIRVGASNNLNMTDTASISAKTLSTGQGGRVNLRSNNDVTLDGHINVDGQEGGGRVYVTAENNLTSNANISGYSGIIGSGGAALLFGGGETNVNGDIAMNGTSGGGVIVVNGNGVNLAEESSLSARGLESELPEVTRNTGGRIAVHSSLGDLNAAGRINADGFNSDFGAVRLVGNNVNISGQVAARAVNSGTGGTVLASATNDVNLTGSINTDGIDGGGLVRLRADNGVAVADTGLINNNAVTNGTGGHVLLKGTVNNNFAGRINSRGGSASGDGGYVGISQPNTVTGVVNVSAPNGNDGTFNH
jgi:filamentous hemagglutinin family protein